MCAVPIMCVDWIVTNESFLCGRVNHFQISVSEKNVLIIGYKFL